MEVGFKVKAYNDPLNVMKRYLGSKSGGSSSGTTTTPIKKEENTIPVIKPSTSSYISPLVHISDIKAPSASSSSYRRKKDKKKRSKSKKSKKEKKDKKSRKRRRRSTSSSSNSSLDQEDEAVKRLKIEKLNHLRAERLKREQAERKRTDELLSRVTGIPLEKPVSEKDTAIDSNHSSRPMIKQKYNSQFNPELAKQNYE